MVELGANDIDEQQTAHLANARDKSLVDGGDALHPVAHHTETDTHHHQGKTTVRHDTGRETAGQEAPHHIEQDGVRNQHKRQYQQQKENALEESQTHGDALAVLGGSVMQNATVLQGSKHEREKQKPHQQGRLHIAHKATENQRIPSALSRERGKFSGIAAVSSHDVRISTTCPTPSSSATHAINLLILICLQIVYVQNVKFQSSHH